MTPENFCYWLRGYFEIHGNKPCLPEPAPRWNLNDSQIDMINEHLRSVFEAKIMTTPSKIDDLPIIPSTFVR